MTEQATVTLQRDGRVARIRFNRPDSLNGLDAQLPFDLCDALDEVSADDSVRAVVLEGEGRAFMAGGDLKYFKGLIEQREDNNGEVVSEAMFREIHGVVEKMRAMPKPMIAKVHGACAGIGLSYMLGCDLAIAAESSLFTVAYPTIGITPDGGSSWHLPRIVGLRKAMELVLLSDRLNAQQALDIGLVNFVVSDHELEGELHKILKRLISLPVHALARSKELMNASFDQTLSEQLRMEARYFAQGSRESEFAEGIDAFVGKRQADFDSLDLKPSKASLKDQDH
ncbi:MAG: enoyl-CoA hydratase/isomerase family protein [Pseudomonadota bacterium]